ncbi:hypothetical protein BDN70DRAFT_108713 [Pholiota conissans]|uniref:Uncharacterized protein n=1 Tax=Pholiota conissans TaxID=109636 RepID=A0A9P5YZF2_9AGAR|nr:hypothetical protein BDN70DRAFT_108713 [Pholiota conissans]
MRLSMSTSTSIPPILSLCIRRLHHSSCATVSRFTTPSALLPPPSSLPPLAPEPITIRTPPSLISESLRHCACALRVHLVRGARRSLAGTYSNYQALSRISKLASHPGYDFEIRLSHEGPGSMLSSPRTRFMSPHPKRPMTPRSELLEARHCDGVKLLRVILFKGYLCREISF